MNTRNTGNKTEVENLYKTALEGQDETGPHSSTLHTSTPIVTSTHLPKPINFALDESVIAKPQTETPCELRLLVSASGDSGDVIIDPGSEVNYNFKFKDPDGTMPPNNPFATLKYAVEAVPFFDGKNIPLNYFIEGCEEAKSMLPDEAESQFTKILRTRIVGEARRTIQDQDFDSVAQLTQYLKQAYGDTKNVYQLQGELGCIYQKNEEDVITYANRVKILGKQILEAYKNTGNTLPNQNIKGSLERDMCKCFIRGLKPEIEQRIARNLDVQETVADALRIEREVRSMTDLRQGQGSGYTKKPKTDLAQETCQICRKEGHLASNCRKLTQFSPPNVGSGTEILICQICKKRGHNADKCRFRDPRNQRPVNIIQENKITCQLCSKPGHNAKNCRTNNTNNSINQNKASITCQWCDKPGHLANNCWKKQNEQRNAGNNTGSACQICNNFGHIAKDCRSKIGQNAVSKDSLFCRYCKGQGHLLENCELRVASNNRRNANNQGNSNGPLKPGVPQGSERVSHPSTSQKAQ